MLLKEVKIMDAGAKGKAIARLDNGLVLFVEGAVPGDVCDVLVHKKRRSFLEGKPIKFHSYSEKRRPAKCEHFGLCGGCKWQFMDYAYQLEYKQKEVEDTLNRLGGIELLKIESILACENEFRYRNKMDFAFTNRRWITEEESAKNQQIRDRNGVGLRVAGFWDKVINLNECHLQKEPSNAIRKAARDYANHNNYEFFDIAEKKGFLRTLTIRMSSTGDIMVLFQFFFEDIEKIEGLLNHIANQFPKITSLLYTINHKGNETIFDLDIITFKGQDCIFEEMEDLQFKIGPKSFYQTNSKQAYELYKVVRQFANIQDNDIVYDLYTGTGTIAQFVSKKALKVIGVESVPEAIEAAKENTKINKIDNCKFYVGDMKTVFTEELIRKNGLPDVVITDPPRDGMHKKVIGQLLDVAPKRIVYVSCNPATQARDLALMNEHYKVEKVQPVDMFPQTYHVENVVLLEKR
ncbi:MAG: 23S rRNA (uracil(1939)-C(5))-methyltransferase RlmD [Bacteroidota bacterium]|nr:23S rRNA (uracil(1939)-C(5))-methyltransferase RlmD [Bacteroidota bacterium]